MAEHDLDGRDQSGRWRTLAVTGCGALFALALVALQHRGARSATHPAGVAPPRAVQHVPAAVASPTAGPVVFVTPEAASTILIVSTDSQAATVRQAWEEAAALRSQMNGTPPGSVVILVVPESLTPGSGSVFQPGTLGTGTTILDLRGH
jgi:hypothetical protein